MDKKPLVSILMATYNRAGFLPRSVRSVVEQKYENWELLIVDDGSADKTRAVAEKLSAAEPRIRYIRHEHTGRIAAISNFGLKFARGRFIAILDDDDYWLDREKLLKQVRFMEENPDYAGCGGGIIILDGDGRETGRVLKPETHAAIRKRALIANGMANSTTVFRREDALAAGLYDESLLQFADWDFWLKMGLRGKLYNFQDYFAAYAMWPAGSSFSRQHEAARSALRVVFRYRGRYPGFSLALPYVMAYLLYAYLPTWLKKHWNPFLSRLKKNLFSA